MTGQQLQTLGAWAIVVGALVWIASYYLREAVRRLRARQAAGLVQQDADWEAHVASVQDMLEGDPTDDCHTLDELEFAGSVLADIDEFCGGAA